MDTKTSASVTDITDELSKWSGINDPNDSLKKLFNITQPDIDPLNNGDITLFIVRATNNVDMDKYNKVRRTNAEVKINKSLAKVGHIGMTTNLIKDPYACFINCAGKSLSVVKYPKASIESAFYLAACQNVLQKKCETETNKSIFLQLLDNSIEICNIGRFTPDDAKKMHFLLTNCLIENGLLQEKVEENWFNINKQSKAVQMKIAEELIIHFMGKGEWKPLNPFHLVQLYRDSENKLAIANINANLFDGEYLIDLSTIKHYAASAAKPSLSLPLNFQDISNLNLNNGELLPNMMYAYNLPETIHICSLPWLDLVDTYRFCSHKIAERPDFAECTKSGYTCIFSYIDKLSDDDLQHSIKHLTKKYAATSPLTPIFSDPMEILRSPEQLSENSSEEKIEKFFADVKMLRCQAPECKIRKIRSHEKECSTLYCHKHRKEPEIMASPHDASISLKKLFTFSKLWFNEQMIGEEDKETFKKWESFFEFTCATYFLKNATIIGGDGKIVYVDLVNVTYKTYYGDSINKWYIVGVESDNGGFLIETTETTTKSTFLQKIEKYIVNGTTCVSNLWRNKYKTGKCSKKVDLNWKIIEQDDKNNVCVIKTLAEEWKKKFYEDSFFHFWSIFREKHAYKGVSALYALKFKGNDDDVQAFYNKRRNILDRKSQIDIFASLSYFGESIDCDGRLKTHFGDALKALLYNTISPKCDLILTSWGPILKKEYDGDTINLTKTITSSMDMCLLPSFPNTIYPFMEYVLHVVFNVAATTQETVTGNFLIDHAIWKQEEELYLLQKSLADNFPNKEDLKILMKEQNILYDNIKDFYDNGGHSLIEPQRKQAEQIQFKNNIKKCYQLMMSSNRQLPPEMTSRYDDLTQLFFNQFENRLNELKIGASLIVNGKDKLLDKTSLKPPESCTIKLRDGSKQKVDFTKFSNEYLKLDISEKKEPIKKYITKEGKTYIGDSWKPAENQTKNMLRNILTDKIGAVMTSSTHAQVDNISKDEATPARRRCAISSDDDTDVDIDDEQIRCRTKRTFTIQDESEDDDFFI